MICCLYRNGTHKELFNMPAIALYTAPRKVMDDFMQQINHVANPSLKTLKEIAQGNFFHVYREYFPADASLIDRVIFLRNYARANGKYDSVNLPSQYRELVDCLSNMVDFIQKGGHNDPLYTSQLLENAKDMLRKYSNN